MAPAHDPPSGTLTPGPCQYFSLLRCSMEDGTAVMQRLHELREAIHLHQYQYSVRTVRASATLSTTSCTANYRRWKQPIPT